MQGRGTFHYEPSGDVYAGHWLRGMRHGYGEYTWFNGNTYKGDWIANNIYGHGVFYNPTSRQR